MTWFVLSSSTLTFVVDASRGGLEVESWTDNCFPSASVEQIPVGECLYGQIYQILLVVDKSSPAIYLSTDVCCNQSYLFGHVN